MGFISNYTSLTDYLCAIALHAKLAQENPGLATVDSMASF